MAKRGAKPKKKAGGKKKKQQRADFDLGPIETIKVRVPINEAVYQKKESELAQLEVVIAKKKRSIAPTLLDIRGLRKQVAGLTVDIENNTEERDERVRRRWDYKHNEVTVYRASDMKVLEKRTMTAGERKRTLDFEDGRFQGEKKGTPSDGDSGLPPAEAIAAARDAGEEADDDDEDPTAEEIGEE